MRFIKASIFSMPFQLKDTERGAQRRHRRPAEFVQPFTCRPIRHQATQEDGRLHVGGFFTLFYCFACIPPLPGDWLIPVSRAGKAGFSLQVRTCASAL